MSRQSAAWYVLPKYYLPSFCSICADQLNCKGKSMTEKTRTVQHWERARDSSWVLKRRWHLYPHARDPCRARDDGSKRDSSCKTKNEEDKSRYNWAPMILRRCCSDSCWESRNKIGRSHTERRVLRMKWYQRILPVIKREIEPQDIAQAIHGHR